MKHNSVVARSTHVLGQLRKLKTAMKRARGCLKGLFKAWLEMQGSDRQLLDYYALEYRRMEVPEDNFDRLRWERAAGARPRSYPEV